MSLDKAQSDYDNQNPFDSQLTTEQYDLLVFYESERVKDRLIKGDSRTLIDIEGWMNHEFEAIIKLAAGNAKDAEIGAMFRKALKAAIKEDAEFTIDQERG